MSFFDTGIDDIYLEEVDFEKLNISPRLQRIIKADLSKQNKGESFGALNSNRNLYFIKYINGEIKAKMLMTVHHQIGSDNVEYFTLGDEIAETYTEFLAEKDGVLGAFLIKIRAIQST